MKFNLDILVYIVFVFTIQKSTLSTNRAEKSEINAIYKKHLDFSQMKCEFCDKFKKMFDDAEKLKLNLYNSYIVHYHYVY